MKCKCTCFKTILYAGISSEDLTSLKNEEIGLEGTSVTLSCKYSRTANVRDYFYWYRQDTAQRPEFLLSIFGSDDITKVDLLNPRRSVKMNEEKTRVDLMISSAEVTDSVLYYCASSLFLKHSKMSMSINI
uniref:Ig-like domain-containing protein n=1 Tax=Esox lucius TaxID=8010 RepID=A0A3P8Y027_ESOLU